MLRIFVKNLCKSYKDKCILQDLNLDIQAGDFITLLGASGCGKTTLLNILGGFSGFDSGEIVIESLSDKGDSKSRSDSSGEVKSASYFGLLDISPERVKVFQNYVLLPWKDALNQVMFALQSRFVDTPKSELKDIALHYLELVGLKEHAHKFPHELSGGQQSRVSIARALSVKPSMLLMDEPFGALDSFTRENLQRELKDVADSLNTTCVFVTHDVEEALALGSRVIVMSAQTKGVSLSLSISRPYERQDPYFHHLKGEIYENLRYPYNRRDYVI